MKYMGFFLLSFSLLNGGVEYEKYELRAKPIKFELTLQCEPVSEIAWWKIWERLDRNYYERSLLNLCTEEQRKNRETIQKVVTDSEDFEVKKGEFQKQIPGFPPDSSFYGRNSKTHYEPFEVLKEVKRVVTYSYDLQRVDPNGKWAVIKKGTLTAGGVNEKDNIVDLSDLNLTITKYTNSYDIDEDVACVEGTVFSRKYKSLIMEKDNQPKTCPYVKIGQMTL